MSAAYLSAIIFRTQLIVTLEYLAVPVSFAALALEPWFIVAAVVLGMVGLCLSLANLLEYTIYFRVDTGGDACAKAWLCGNDKLEFSPDWPAIRWRCPGRIWPDRYARWICPARRASATIYACRAGLSLPAPVGGRFARRVGA
jgi:hypothetical protein